MSNLDERAKDALDKRTEQETIGLKDEIWNDLEKELFSEEKVNRREVKNLKKKNRVIPIIMTSAAALVIAFAEDDLTAIRGPLCATREAGGCECELKRFFPSY